MHTYTGKSLRVPSEAKTDSGYIFHAISLVSLSNDYTVLTYSQLNGVLYNGSNIT